VSRPRALRRRRSRMIGALRWQAVDGRAGCPHCGLPMRRRFANQADNAATMDHILPACMGGGNTRENLRVVCRLCNETRAAVGHCVGAMACARAALCTPRPPVGRVVAWWRATGMVRGMAA
jgi:hypothetical protein